MIKHFTYMANILRTHLIPIKKLVVDIRKGAILRTYYVRPEYLDKIRKQFFAKVGKAIVKRVDNIEEIEGSIRAENPLIYLPKLIENKKKEFSIKLNDSIRKLEDLEELLKRKAVSNRKEQLLKIKKLKKEVISIYEKLGQEFDEFINTIIERSPIIKFRLKDTETIDDFVINRNYIGTNLLQGFFNFTLTLEKKFISKFLTYKNRLVNDYSLYIVRFKNPIVEKIKSTGLVISPQPLNKINKTNDKNNKSDINNIILLPVIFGNRYYIIKSGKSKYSLIDNEIGQIVNNIKVKEKKFIYENIIGEEETVYINILRYKNGNLVGTLLSKFINFYLPHFTKLEYILNSKILGTNFEDKNRITWNLLYNPVLVFDSDTDIQPAIFSQSIITFIQDWTALLSGNLEILPYINKSDLKKYYFEIPYYFYKVFLKNYDIDTLAIQYIILQNKFLKTLKSSHLQNKSTLPPQLQLYISTFNKILNILEKIKIVKNTNNINNNNGNSNSKVLIEIRYILDYLFGVNGKDIEDGINRLGLGEIRYLTEVGKIILISLLSRESFNKLYPYLIERYLLNSKNRERNKWFIIGVLTRYIPLLNLLSVGKEVESVGGQHLIGNKNISVEVIKDNELSIELENIEKTLIVYFLNEIQPILNDYKKFYILNLYSEYIFKVLNIELKKSRDVFKFIYKLIDETNPELFWDDYERWGKAGIKILSKYLPNLDINTLLKSIDLVYLGKLIRRNIDLLLEEYPKHLIYSGLLFIDEYNTNTNTNNEESKIIRKFFGKQIENNIESFVPYYIMLSTNVRDIIRNLKDRNIDTLDLVDNFGLEILNKIFKGIGGLGFIWDIPIEYYIVNSLIIHFLTNGQARFYPQNFDDFMFIETSNVNLAGTILNKIFSSKFLNNIKDIVINSDTFKSIIGNIKSFVETNTDINSNKNIVKYYHPILFENFENINNTNNITNINTIDNNTNIPTQIYTIKPLTLFLPLISNNTTNKLNKLTHIKISDLTFLTFNNTDNIGNSGNVDNSSDSNNNISDLIRLIGWDFVISFPILPKEED